MHIIIPQGVLKKITFSGTIFPQHPNFFCQTLLISVKNILNNDEEEIMYRHLRFHLKDHRTMVGQLAEIP